MQFMLQPCHILLAALIDWANERQQQIIEFQNDPIEALLKQLGKKPLLLTDDQCRVLAARSARSQSLMGVLPGFLAFFGWTSLKLGGEASAYLLESISLLVLLAVLVAVYRLSIRGKSGTAPKSAS
ncbi:MAG: hypothetical protein O2820_07750 [Planctomycetota bacterium]|nr:hypothetical protein [Planctomycetota bacterium]